MKSRFFQISLLAGIFLLSGCTAGVGARTTGALLTGGDPLPPEMVNANQIAIVREAEAFAGTYSRRNRALLYVQGVHPDYPEFRFRTVMLRIAFIKGAYFMKDGQFSYFTAGYAPDNIKRLTIGDVVELRATGTFDVMANFANTKEGNAILRVLCRKADPDYQACIDQLPSIGTYKGVGHSGTPFLSSLKEYGLTFSPAYSQDGTLLRSFE